MAQIGLQHPHKIKRAYNQKTKILKSQTERSAIGASPLPALRFVIIIFGSSPNWSTAQ